VHAHVESERYEHGAVRASGASSERYGAVRASGASRCTPERESESEREEGKERARTCFPDFAGEGEYDHQ
jgi:hypothetical protein